MFGLFVSYRCEFSEYLRRPDHKQEFLLQWQQSYNALPAHLRREDSVKAELHHRVDVRCCLFCTCKVCGSIIMACLMSRSSSVLF